MSDQRTGKPTRHDVLPQLETQEVPADRREEAASGVPRLTGSPRAGQLRHAPGQVLRELRRVRGVELHVEGKVPGNTWHRSTVRPQVNSKFGLNRNSQNLSDAPLICFFISFTGSNQF